VPLWGNAVGLPFGPWCGAFSVSQDAHPLMQGGAGGKRGRCRRRRRSERGEQRTLRTPRARRRLHRLWGLCRAPSSPVSRACYTRPWPPADDGALCGPGRGGRSPNASHVPGARPPFERVALRLIPAQPSSSPSHPWPLNHETAPQVPKASLNGANGTGAHPAAAKAVLEPPAAPSAADARRTGVASSSGNSAEDESNYEGIQMQSQRSSGLYVRVSWQGRHPRGWHPGPRIRHLRRPARAPRPQQRRRPPRVPAPAPRAAVPGQVRNMVKHFNTNKGVFKAVQGIDVDIEPSSIVALLGPSGSGKTTLLRLIAGLEGPTDGKILFDDLDATDLPVQDRQVGAEGAGGRPAS
jgi:hypothetical protein